MLASVEAAFFHPQKGGNTEKNRKGGEKQGKAHQRAGRKLKWYEGEENNSTLWLIELTTRRSKKKKNNEEDYRKERTD